MNLIYKAKPSYIVNDDRRLDQNNLSFSSFSINLDRKIKESFKSNKVFGRLHAKFWRPFHPSLRKFTFFYVKEIKSFLFFNTFCNNLKLASIDRHLYFCIVSAIWRPPMYIIVSWNTIFCNIKG